MKNKRKITEIPNRKKGWKKKKNKEKYWDRKQEKAFKEKKWKIKGN